VLLSWPLKDPVGCVALLVGVSLILLQDLVDDPHLRFRHRPAAACSGR